MQLSHKITPRVNICLYTPRVPKGIILVLTKYWLDAGHPYLFGEPALMNFRSGMRIALPLLQAQGSQWVSVQDMALDVFELQEIENLWDARLAREVGEISIESIVYFAKLQRTAGASLN